MSDDDESFIILGTTPTSSIDFAYGSPNSSTYPMQLIKSKCLNGAQSLPKQEKDKINVMEVSAQTENNFSLCNGSQTPMNQSQSINPATSSSGNSLPNGKLSLIPNQDSIASQFLCGEVSCNEILQASVLSQFPSIPYMNTEDNVKLQMLITDNHSLKENLEKSNKVLRRHFSLIQQYQSEVQTKQEEYKASEDKLTAENLSLKKQIISNAEKYNAEVEILSAAHQNQLTDMKLLVAKFDKENQILNQEMKEQTERFKIHYDTAKQENDELVKQVSEKLSIIQNLSSEMDKLEMNAGSFVVFPTDSSKSNVEYMQKSQHVNTVQKLEEEKAALRNKNIEQEKALRDNVEQMHSMIEEINNFKKKENEHQQAIEEREVKLKELRTYLSELKISSDLYEEKLSMKIEEIKRLKTEMVASREVVMQQEQSRSNEKDNELKRAIEDREAQMKVMRHDLSELKVKNIQYEDTIITNTEEIEKLKKNLDAAHERTEKLQENIARLLAEHSVFEKTITDKNVEMNGVKEQVTVLETQLQIYKNDFEAERKSREDIAGEKQQILTDLTLLQKRHQELIKETQKSLGNDLPPENLAFTSENGVPGGEDEAVGGDNDEQYYNPNKYMCPICNKTYRNFILLNNHVQDCLNTP